MWLGIQFLYLVGRTRASFVKNNPSKLKDLSVTEAKLMRLHDRRKGKVP